LRRIARAGDRHALREREPGQRGAARTVRAAGIRVVVDEGGLLCGGRIADIRLGARVEAAGAIGRELRDRNRGEDADDGHHDEHLDQREARSGPTLRCFYMGPHVSPPRETACNDDARDVARGWPSGNRRAAGVGTAKAWGPVLLERRPGATNLTPRAAPR